MNSTLKSLTLLLTDTGDSRGQYVYMEHHMVANRRVHTIFIWMGDKNLVVHIFLCRGMDRRRWRPSPPPLPLLVEVKIVYHVTDNNLDSKCSGGRQKRG